MYKTELMVRQARAEVFESNVRRRGIKGVVIDWDDTASETTPLFLHHISAFNSNVTAETEIDTNEFSKSFTSINNERFKKNGGVGPSSFDIVCEALCQAYPQLRERIYDNAYLLKRIFTISPELRTGTFDFLFVLSATNLGRFFVSQANLKWAKDIRLPETGLVSYFHDYHVVDENGHKTAEDWTEALDKFKLKPQEVLVIGDNKEGDILAAYSIGVRNLVWVDYKQGWSEYRRGELPDGTLIVKDLQDFLNKTLLGKY